MIISNFKRHKTKNIIETIIKSLPTKKKSLRLDRFTTEPPEPDLALILHKLLHKLEMEEYDQTHLMETI